MKMPIPYGWIVFLLSSSNFFLSQFYRASNAVIAPTLVQELSLDTEQLGVLSGVFFWGFAVTQIPISLLLDRLGPRRIMSFLSLVGIAGAFVFSFAHSFGVGLAGRALLGLGMACNLMGTLKLLTVWFGPLRFATLSGIIFSIGTLGNMAASSPFVLLVDLMGWRPTFRLIAFVNLFLVTFFYLAVRDRPRETTLWASQGQEASDGAGSLSHLRLLLKSREYWIISISTMTNYGVFAAFQALWAGPYLMEALGLPAMVAGHILLLMNLGLLVGPTLWGILSDRVFKTRKWLVVGGQGAFCVLAASLAALGPGTIPRVLGLLFFCFGLFRSTGLLMYTQIKEVMPIYMAGTAMTGINFFTMIGPALFLHGLGTLMQTLYPHASRGPEAFTAAFLLCSACLAGITVTFLFTKDTRGQT